MPHKVKVASDKLRELPFPNYAVSDDLEGLLAELAEFDAHIAGIATTVVNGGRSPWKIDQQEIARFRRDLESIRISEPEDLDVLSQIYGYLDALENLARLLR